jgi:phosphoribosyl-ATP pyrophosphohydrolase
MTETRSLPKSEKNRISKHREKLKKKEKKRATKEWQEKRISKLLARLGSISQEKIAKKHKIEAFEILMLSAKNIKHNIIQRSMDVTASKVIILQEKIKILDLEVSSILTELHEVSNVDDQYEE